MDHNPAPSDDRRDELLADRALQGLDPDERAELADHPDAVDDDSLDLAAAEADLALTGALFGAMPAGLRRSIEAQARHHVGPKSPSASPFRLVGRTLPWLGWVAAAAASLLLIVRPPPAPEPGPTRLPTVQERLAGAEKATLIASDHPLARDAGGLVAWDNERQEGYLALDGLAGVDPRRGAYQLWIFDAKRDARYPVDGGLFRVAEGQRSAVVPIRATVPVRQPTLFAVTLEPPEGVVVSDRKRIMLTAAWQGPAENPR